MLFVNHTSKIHKVFCLLLKPDEKCHIIQLKNMVFSKALLFLRLSNYNIRKMKLQRWIFTVLFLIVCENIKASDFYYLPAYLREGDSCIITMNGKSRSSPARNASKTDDLVIGEKVYIIEQGEQEEMIFGIKAPFCKVRYKKQDLWKEAYVWAGLLSLSFSKDKNGMVYAVGARAFLPDEHSRCVKLGLLLLDINHQLVYEQDMFFETGEQSFVESKVLSPMGLTNVKSVFRVGFLGRACGIMTEYLYYAWTGREFIQLPSKRSMGDADIYGYSEELFFPLEHRNGDNLIIIRQKEYQYERFEVADQTSYDEFIKVTEEWYRWDGKKVVMLERKREEGY